MNENVITFLFGSPQADKKKPSKSKTPETNLYSNPGTWTNTAMNSHSEIGVTPLDILRLYKRSTLHNQKS